MHGGVDPEWQGMEGHKSHQGNGLSMWLELLAIFGLGLYISVLIVQSIGVVQLKRLYSRPLSRPISGSLPLPDVPYVTVIRPVKGVEPYLYECLAATFQQNYPPEKLTISFCISTCNDPAHPILERLLADFPTFDAKIYVEEEDPNLMCPSSNCRIHSKMGPNPKIRNMSRAYREAKGDIMWIIDCNVWISPSVAGLMVDRLCGFGPSDTRKRKYKFVHQLPLVVDVSGTTSERDGKPQSQSFRSRIRSSGGLLEELFLSTSHAKFYTAISTVAVAPCTVGKSNMFRRSHLDALTRELTRRQAIGAIFARPCGIDYFSNNICEDHLIGDLLWYKSVPPKVVQKAASEGGVPVGEENIKATANWANHALVLVPPCVQPLSYLPLTSYTARRTRWLRARKYTVLMATLIEPCVESLLCSTYGAFVLTTLPFCNTVLNIPPTWTAFWTIWWCTMLPWVTVDYYVWALLQSWSGEFLQSDEPKPPSFVGSGRSRLFRQWFLAWLGREFLAFPIWFVAVVGGTSVKWRGKTFKVGLDAKVKQIEVGERVGEGFGLWRLWRGWNVRGRVHKGD